MPLDDAKYHTCFCSMRKIPFRLATCASLTTLHHVVHAQINSSLRASSFSSSSTNPIALHTAPPIGQIISPCLDILVYPLRDLQKRPLDSFPALGARLYILHHAFPPAPFLCLLPRHLAPVPALCVCALGGEIALVPDEND